MKDESASQQKRAVLPTDLVRAQLDAIEKAPPTIGPSKPPPPPPPPA